MIYKHANFRKNVGSTPTRPFPTTGLFAFWRMDGLTASYGTFPLINDGAVSFDSGYATFNGSNRLLETSSQIKNALTSKGDLTISYWVKSSQTGTGDASIFGLWGASSSFNQLVATYTKSNGACSMYIHVGGGAIVYPTTNGPSIADGAWHHIVVTRSGSEVALFIDSTAGYVRSGNNTSGVYGGSGTFSFGGPQGAASNFAGSLNSVGMWGRALTPTERADLYNGGFGNQY
jgi:hypothetical protein